VVAVPSLCALALKLVDVFVACATVDARVADAFVHIDVAVATKRNIGSAFLDVALGDVL
jgi:hypothetical protein